MEKGLKAHKNNHHFQISTWKLDDCIACISAFEAGQRFYFSTLLYIIISITKAITHLIDQLLKEEKVRVWIYLFNEIKNGNGKCIKDNVTQSKSKKSTQGNQWVSNTARKSRTFRLASTAPETKLCTNL